MLSKAFHGSGGFQNLTGRVGSGRVKRGFEISRIGSDRVKRF